MNLDAAGVAQALKRGGPATLDALAHRLGEPDRDALLWAVEEARSRGWLAGGDGPDCGPDGLCGTSAPAVYRLRTPEELHP